VVGVGLGNQFQDAAVLALRHPGWRDPGACDTGCEEGMAARPSPTRLTRQGTTTCITMLWCMTPSSTSPLQRRQYSPVRVSMWHPTCRRQRAAPWQVATELPSSSWQTCVRAPNSNR